MTLHNANWKADYLANHVEISDATLHVVSGELHWDPINFVYGPLKGTRHVDRSERMRHHLSHARLCTLPKFQHAVQRS